jgi:hypothetical protein
MTNQTVEMILLRGSSMCQSEISRNQCAGLIKIGKRKVFWMFISIGRSMGGGAEGGGKEGEGGGGGRGEEIGNIRQNIKQSLAWLGWA